MNRAFTQLVKEAAGCTLCPAMCGRRAVLSELNGSPGARVMFIGEAPGRKGADRTRVPFSGDQSGANLERFLSSIKLTQKELANCSGFLRRTIEIVNPRVIVTLGSVALEALKRIQYHELSLKKSAARIHSWNDRVLVPIYHPSPQVLASHRREAEQLEDYKVVKKACRGLTRINADHE